MSLFIRKKQEVYHLTGIAKLSAVSFFTALASAVVTTVWAVYLDSFVNDISTVGFITSFFALLSFGLHFAIIPLIEKSNKAKLYAASLVLNALSYLTLILTKNLLLFVIIGSIITIAEVVRIATFGIIIRDKSENNLTRNEGLIYTIFNIAFLIGPILAAFLANKSSEQMVFVLASIFVFISFAMFKFFGIKDAHISKRVDLNPIRNFIDFFKSKDRVIAYFLSGGVNLWWALIYIFMPLYIVRNGLSELWIGYFFFAVTLPLIALEYIFANKIKENGFRKMFITGYAIVCLISLIAFFITNIYVMLPVLVLASIGMAMIEPTTETYFFKILKKGEENRFYSPYNTTIDVSYFIGKIIPAIALLIFPFRSIFIVYAILMFLLFLLAFKTRNIKS